MSNWDALLRRVLHGLDFLGTGGNPIPGLSFGGGTALMLQLHHRDSKDIDLFVSDPQYLGYLTPRLADPAMWGGADYDESSHYVKLRYAEGEIDFIAAAPISDLSNGVFIFEQWQVPIEQPSEIILKKLFHRAELFKPRDIFDTAVVLASAHAETLLAHLHLVSNRRAALLARLTAMPDAYFDAAMRELAIFPDWAFVIPEARSMVLKTIEALPAAPG